MLSYFRSFVNSGASTSKGSSTSSSGEKKPESGGGRGNIFGFGGTSYPGSSGGGLLTKGKSGTIVVNPKGPKVKDNSSSGSSVGNVPVPSTSPEPQITGGQRLGSSSGSDGLASDPRSKLREVWGQKKFGGAAEKVANEVRREKMADCPVCGESVPEATINSHLDECLSSQSEGYDKDSRLCPVCKREVLKEEFSFHQKFCS